MQLELPPPSQCEDYAQREHSHTLLYLGRNIQHGRNLTLTFEDTLQTIFTRRLSHESLAALQQHQQLVLLTVPQAASFEALCRSIVEWLREIFDQKLAVYSQAQTRDQPLSSNQHIESISQPISSFKRITLNSDSSGHIFFEGIKKEMGRKKILKSYSIASAPQNQFTEEQVSSQRKNSVEPLLKVQRVIAFPDDTKRGTNQFGKSVDFQQQKNTSCSSKASDESSDHSPPLVSSITQNGGSKYHTRKTSMFKLNSTKLDINNKFPLLQGDHPFSQDSLVLCARCQDLQRRLQLAELKLIDSEFTVNSLRDKVSALQTEITELTRQEQLLQLSHRHLQTRLSFFLRCPDFLVPSELEPSLLMELDSAINVFDFSFMETISQPAKENEWQSVHCQLDLNAELAAQMKGFARGIEIGAGEEGGGEGQQGKGPDK